MSFRSRTTSVASPALDPTVQALRGAAADAQRSRLPQMAAALSYRTVFGLLPVVAIGLWILHKLASTDQLNELVRKAADFLGLSRIVVGPPVVGPPSPEALAAQPPDALSIETIIKDLVDRINNVSFSAIGLVGIGMLVYAGVSMVVEVERAFNQIYRVPRGRSWSRRFVNYWALLTWGPMCLFATFYVQQKMNTWIEGFTHGRTGFGTGAITLTVVGYATQVLISALLLLVIYQVVPNTRVRFWSSCIGALVAATIFEASKFAFGEYVEFSAGASYARLYGSLALIPLFLLWVYFTWLIVLFGLQLTCRLQHGRANTRAQPIMEFGPTLVEPAGALAVMTALARAFGEGRTLDAPALAQRSHLPDPVVRLVLSRLAERTLVHRIEGAPGTAEAAEPGYTLARPPSAIRIAELLELGYELAGRSPADQPTPQSPDDPVIERLRKAQIAAAGAETLADAIGASSSPAEHSAGLDPALLRPRSNGAPPRPAAVSLGAEPAPAPAADRPRV